MAFLVDTVTIDHRSRFQKLWTGFINWCNVVGYSRAAAHLASQGYYEEAKHCMEQLTKLKRN
jgi:hypothetical protein